MSAPCPPGCELALIEHEHFTPCDVAGCMLDVEHEHGGSAALGVSECLDCADAQEDITQLTADVAALRAALSEAISLHHDGYESRAAKEKRVAWSQLLRDTA